ncbi:MAG: type II toxin-antitoxin system PemK/MazF family toxin [Nanoarchaeota archaeon]|nr:type II toxin-antitoxin system PemK/MazF family toxin [Nanoarchaeota archaeon]MBU4116191.1 type II toxin-antitoxin system PemK/MazF family toxin [Nanoarchaeota archaeon]
MEIKRGDIVLAGLEPVKGSEQGGIRPVLIIQNDGGNKFSPTTIIAPITSKKFSKEFPTNATILKEESKLNNDSTVLLNQIRTIDKARIIKRISALDVYLMNKVDLAIKISLGLD